MTDSKADRWSVRGPFSGFVGLGRAGRRVWYWAAVSQITGAVIAPGADRGGPERQVVQHPDGGVVAEILVKEGDSVAEGDLLIRLEPVDLQSELAVVEGQCSRCWPPRPVRGPNAIRRQNWCLTP